MQKNFHTHTFRCKHATGLDKEYVERAIQSGLLVLGFSDHIPYPYPKNFSSNIRMDLNLLDNYVDSVLQLKEEYKKDIDIYLGFEAEYFEEYWDKMEFILSPYPIDYMILGQHYLNSEIYGEACNAPTKEENLLKKYVDSLILAISTNSFSYIAHPDIFNFTGDSFVYHHHIVRLCEAAKDQNIPLEINLLGLSQNRTYPDSKFFQIAKEVGNTIVLGRDAHDPIAFLDESTLQKALDFAKKNELEITEDFILRKPFA